MGSFHFHRAERFKVADGSLGVRVGSIDSSAAPRMASMRGARPLGKLLYCPRAASHRLSVILVLGSDYVRPEMQPFPSFEDVIQAARLGRLFRPLRGPVTRPRDVGFQTTICEA